VVLQQVGSYLGYTGRGANPFGKATRDPKRSSSPEVDGCPLRFVAELAIKSESAGMQRNEDATEVVRQCWRQNSYIDQKYQRR
jgi:hypothetical protein